MKITVLILISAITFIANADFEDWFPLAVGNKWQYEALQLNRQHCPASSARRYVINEITRDRYTGQKFRIINGIPRPLENAIDLRGASRTGFLRGIGMTELEILHTQRAFNH